MQNSVEEYIQAIQDPDRQQAVSKLRNLINQHLDPKFNEEISYGMIGWVVPHSLYPAGYHVNSKLPLPFINLASQKNYIALYHLGMYGNPKLLNWFEQEYVKTGHKLDMGKSCIRFKKMNQIPYDLLSKLMTKMSLDEYVEQYQAVLSQKK